MFLPAAQKIEEFLNYQGALAFSCIEKGTSTRKDFAYDLRARSINKQPFKINQGQASLCGPAAFIYSIARFKPDEYVNYVVDLAISGEGHLGNLKVKPSQACLQGTISAEEKIDGKIYISKISPVDWVALASLRDSSNAMLAMNNVKTQVAGITQGSTMAEWFDATGWFHSSNNSSNFSLQPLKNLLDANMSRSTGPVCLLISAAILQGDKMAKFGKPGLPKVIPTANHWVVLLGGMLFDRQTAPFSIPMVRPGWENMELTLPLYTWGNLSVVSRRRYPDMKVGQFLHYYYGFVSAAKN